MAEHGIPQIPKQNLQRLITPATPEIYLAHQFLRKAGESTVTSLEVVSAGAIVIAEALTQIHPLARKQVFEMVVAKIRKCVFGEEDVIISPLILSPSNKIEAERLNQTK